MSLIIPSILCNKFGFEPGELELVDHRKTRWQEALARESLHRHHRYPSSSAAAADINANILLNFNADFIVERR